MTKISFNSENLKVDYLSFNLQFNDFKQIKIIANWLANIFHCRRTLIDQSIKKRHLLTILQHQSYFGIVFPRKYFTKFLEEKKI